MKKSQRTRLINEIVHREKLRPLSRLERLRLEPWRTAPYYLLALIGHLRPFILSFKTLWDTRMTCYLPEGNTFFYYGYAEANLTNFFLRFARAGMTAIDIGAHVGFYSMLLSELVGKDGQIHSFEPTAWTYRLLVKNIAELENVTANNLAATETVATLYFADYGPGYGAYNTAHSRGAPALQRKPQMTQVAAMDLDTYCTQRRLTADIVKIDAEGFEYHVLCGMSEMLSIEGSRPVITLEVAGGDEWSKNRQRSFDFLHNAGYVPHEISVTGQLRAHRPHTFYEYDNLVFIPQEKMARFSGLMEI